MTAYMIFDIEVTDPEGYKEYVKLAPESIKLYDGKYIVRGGQYEIVEGNWQAKRIVVLEFASIKQGKAWLNSPEYASARALRHLYAKTNSIIVEGM
jgi:uncharacterized protein (DUF1330 family)